jgi:hypothetical protein
MSIESMQFLEMVREAAAYQEKRFSKKSRSSGDVEVGMVGDGLFCDMCGNKGMAFLREEERDEIYQCELCGHVRWYRVR